MPVLNAEAHVGEQLAALGAQTYAGRWELLVVDNGCSDRTLEVVRAAASRVPALRIVEAGERRGLGYAKKAGLRAAAGDLIAFCDADDVAVPGWLEALVQAAENADVVGGPLDFEPLNDARSLAWRPDVLLDALEVGNGFLPYVPGGNCAVWADVARAIGWGDHVFGGDDKDFSWRAHLASYRLAFAPGAVIKLRYRTSLRALVRQWYAYGRAGPRLYRDFRAAGMPRDLREGLDAWRWLIARSRNLVHSSERRGNWLRVAAFRCGRLAGSMRFRTIYL
jgi:glycosyltransferase involved in cell wall biosynthesis